MSPINDTKILIVVTEIEKAYQTSVCIKEKGNVLFSLTITSKEL